MSFLYSFSSLARPVSSGRVKPRLFLPDLKWMILSSDTKWAQPELRSRTMPYPAVSISRSNFLISKHENDFHIQSYWKKLERMPVTCLGYAEQMVGTRQLLAVNRSFGLFKLLKLIELAEKQPLSVELVLLPHSPVCSILTHLVYCLLYIYIYIYIYVCVYIYIYIYMHAYIQLYIHAHMYLHIHVPMYV